MQLIGEVAAAMRTLEHRGTREMSSAATIQQPLATGLEMQAAISLENLSNKPYCMTRDDTLQSSGTQLSLEHFIIH